MIVPASANVNAIQREGVRGNMAALTTDKRKSLPDSDFAIPEDREYPDDTASRARNALSRVSQYGTPVEKSQVRSKVRRDYPGITQTAGPRYKP